MARFSRAFDPYQDPEWHAELRRRIVSAQALRTRIVSIAEREYDNWHDPDLTERSDGGRPLVQGYWRTGVRRSVSDEDLASEEWQDGNPWSAAFISYVMREAGAGSDFRYAAAHAVYIREAIDNRRNDLPALFQGYRPEDTTVEPGDIVGKARAGSGATYATVRPGMTTHCDIVTFVDPAAGVVHAIGGNVHQNVDRKTNLTVDAAGHLTATGYFVVIKIVPVLPPLTAPVCPVHPERGGMSSRTRPSASFPCRGAEWSSRYSGGCTCAGPDVMP